MKRLAIFGVLAMMTMFAGHEATNAADAGKTPDALSFKMKGIDGKEVNLADYKGKVVLFVNVASRCGYTPQYKGLQKLHEKYADKGLAIIGVPSNQFGGQEPGSDAEIVEFCKNNYDVEFDMLSKVDVKGDKQTPLYKYLTSEDAGFPGDVKWNFEKFLINREGKVVGRFPSKVEPESSEMVQAIEKALAEKS